MVIIDPAGSKGYSYIAGNPDFFMNKRHFNVKETHFLYENSNFDMKKDHFNVKKSIFTCTVGILP